MTERTHAMPSRPLRIATYNIRKALGTDRRRDPDRILRILRDLNADVVLLQEADMRLPPRPAALPRERIRAVTGLVPVGVPDGNGQSLGAHGNAILINPAFRVERVAAIDLPGFEPRGMLAARLRLPDGRGLWAVGVHLGLLRASRQRQLAALCDWLGAQAGGEPVVVAGDFNERSPTAGLAPLAGRLHVLPPQATFHARLPRWPLDRIAVSPHFEDAAPKVVRNDTTARASDHLPLVASLGWKA